MSQSGVAAVSRPHLHYLDWLRVFSMLAVLLYHTNRFFNFGDWHIKNEPLSLISTIVENGMVLWLMPILFSLSGAAIFYSLRTRSAGEFSKERGLTHRGAVGGAGDVCLRAVANVPRPVHPRRLHR